jgi:hypothetical protein
MTRLLAKCAEDGRKSLGHNLLFFAVHVSMAFPPKPWTRQMLKVKLSVSDCIIESPEAKKRTLLWLQHAGKER